MAPSLYIKYSSPSRARENQVAISLGPMWAEGHRARRSSWVQVHFRPVSKDVANPHGRYRWVFVGGRAVDRLGVKNDDVGEKALLETPALFHSESACRLVGDFMNRFRQSEPSAFTAYFSQQKRKCSIQSRMRPPYHIKAIADDARERMRQSLAQIGLALIDLQYVDTPALFPKQVQHGLHRLTRTIIRNRGDRLSD